MIASHSVGEPVARLAHGSTTGDTYSDEAILSIARQFVINEPVTAAPFPGRGNINLHTYEVHAGNGEFLLQKVNSDVFTMPHRVMNGMMASIEAQAAALAAGKGDGSWSPVELVPTRAGQPFLDLSDSSGLSVWRLMIRIPDSVSYKSLGELPDRVAQLQLAEEVGRGMAIYSDLTSAIDPGSIDGSLPGYRDTRLYYAQFHSVTAGNRTLAEASSLLPADPIVRASTEQHFLLGLPAEAFEARRDDPELAPYLDLIRQKEPFTTGLWSALEAGRIRHTLIHGDTKIENFLFCAETGRVKSLVDLDTIMPFTWLADWGDCIRSMVNVAGEKERDLSLVVVDEDVYEAVARGFLHAVREVTDAEVDLMVFAVQAITLELGLRFLTDYLRGDTYFRLADDDPADLNKVRAMVQLTLYRRLEAGAADAAERLRKYRGATA